MIATPELDFKKPDGFQMLGSRSKTHVPDTGQATGVGIGVMFGAVWGSLEIVSCAIKTVPRHTASHRLPADCSVASPSLPADTPRSTELGILDLDAGKATSR